MRFQAVLLLAIALYLATADAFFLKKVKVVPARMEMVRLNLATDARAAVDNLKEAGHLKVKALTDGIKAIGAAKLAVVQGIKDIKVAKVAKVKSVASAKLAKIEAVKASKVALGKKLLSAKLGTFAGTGANFGISEGTTKLSSSSSSVSLSPLASSPALVSNFGTILQIGGDDRVALYPPINASPTHINIVTYRNDVSNRGQSSGGENNNGHAPRPVVVPVPFTSYGTPLDQRETNGVSTSATKYETPLTRDETQNFSGPSTIHATPFRAIPPSTSYGVPILR